ncbi:hypothetical protein GCM10025856_29370 [Methylophaga marina]|uniref:NUDIX hydrolase N-terminal domain-containing protein n=1 Tax=Methylophaga marina TaxID=45495 RepID=UPI002573D865|nr:NUDIX hydrolase N-terminal domain-containing protein [Methylophaga marina]BDZ75218.1 hypothetical protein GCM10025856_29370 [Methylophaga marina]
MEDIWLQAVKRIHAIAETGREFSHNEYDLERYRDISGLAQQLLASLANTPLLPLKIYSALMWMMAVTLRPKLMCEVWFSKRNKSYS